MKKAIKKMKLVKRAPVADNPAITKKLTAQGKKLAKQRKSVAAADAVTAAPKTRRSKSGVTPAEQSQDALTKPVAAHKDAPRIECRLTVNGVTYPVDASSLERTLGTGRFQHESLIDAWPDAAWVGLLVYLDLPADPLDREVAAQPVKRLVQRLWYEACAGGVPEESKATFDARDAERQAEYKENFTAVKNGSTAKAERARASFGKARESRGGGSKYEPTEELKKKGPSLGGQQAPLYQFFKAGKFGAATTEEATAGMLAHGLKTGTDPKRISSFYLSRWTRDGLLTRV